MNSTKKISMVDALKMATDKQKELGLSDEDSLVCVILTQKVLALNKKEFEFFDYLIRLMLKLE